MKKGQASLSSPSSFIPHPSSFYLLSNRRSLLHRVFDCADQVEGLLR